MEQNNQRNPRRRLNSLILLVAFTAVMLIVSTYAWFSAQRNVSITSITGTVNVAEGLQISLDAKSWTGSIDFDTVANGGGGYDIIDSAYSNVQVTDSNGDVIGTYTHDNKEPSELLPVSTTGKGTAIGATEIPMYRGTNTDTIKLGTIVQTAWTYDDDSDTATAEVATSPSNNPDLYPGYIAFDLFLQNSGITSTDTQALTTMDSTALASASTDVLQLNKDSKVTVKSAGNDTVGLQNTVRVAFAEYSGFAPVTASQTEILPLTNHEDSVIADVAIWEPNSQAHVENILNTNNFIKWDTSIISNYVANDDASDTANYGKFADGEYVPTYALTDTAKGTSITDIYDWKATPTVSADANKLAKQNVVATGATIANPINLLSATDGSTEFKIYKNTVVKLRVYIWLEGQDVDCTNYASHGGGIDVDIGLVKSEETVSTGVQAGNYAGS